MAYDKIWWEDFRRQEVEEILALTGKKNNDYTGGQDIDNPFANFDESSEFGVSPIVDKFQRAKAFCRDGKLSVNTEGDTVRDIFRDNIGYSLIALGILERNNGQS